LTTRKLIADMLDGVFFGKATVLHLNFVGENLPPGLDFLIQLCRVIYTIGTFALLDCIRRCVLPGSFYTFSTTTIMVRRYYSSILFGTLAATCSLRLQFNVGSSSALFRIYTRLSRFAPSEQLGQEVSSRSLARVHSLSQ
jgi:hypothetical protein